MLPSRSLLFAALCAFLLCFAGGTRLHAQTASQLYTLASDAYDHGDIPTAKQKLQLALQLDKNFRPASAMLAKIAVQERDAATGRSTVTLEKARTSVEFNDTTLASALEFMRSKVAAESGNKLLINFAVNLPPELASKKITLKMDDVPVLQVFRYMGQLAGVKFERQQYAIVVTPAEDASATTTTAPVSAATPGA